MKTKVFLLALLLTAILNVTVYAQPAVTQQHAYGGLGGSYTADMKITADGGLIIGGSSFSKKGYDKTKDSYGDYGDFWVVKTDAAGRVLWDKTLGGIDDEVLTSVNQTRDHGYLIGGTSVSGISFDKTGASRGGIDYWVVKLDSNGNKLWDKTLGGSGDDYPHSIDTTSDGGFIIGGASNSPISGEKTSGVFGTSDFWIVKLDSSGNIQWDKTIGGNGDDQLYSLKQTRDGGYILGGNSTSGISGNKTEKVRGPIDFWIVKTDATGNVVWDKTLGGNGGENLRSIIQTADGGYLAGGISDSNLSGDKTKRSRGGTDYWIVKLDAAANVLWDNTFGGFKADELSAVQQTKDSGYILTGSSPSDASIDKTESARTAGLPDYWVIKTDKGGNKQWDKTIGGAGLDYSYAVSEYKRNNYVVAGRSTSSVSYDRTKRLKGSCDYWIVLLNYTKPAVSIAATTVVSANESKVADNNFIIYPNPSKDIIYVQSTGKAAFVLTNQSGKTVLTKIINGNGQISVAHLPAGIYYLQNTATGAKQKIAVE